MLLYLVVVVHLWLPLSRSQETFVRVLGVDGTGDAWRVEALDLYSDEACTSRLAMGTVTNYYATMLDSSGAESYTCPCWGGDHGSCPCNDASNDLGTCNYFGQSSCTDGGSCPAGRCAVVFQLPHVDLKCIRFYYNTLGSSNRFMDTVNVEYRSTCDGQSGQWESLRDNVALSWGTATSQLITWSSAVPTCADSSTTTITHTATTATTTATTATQTGTTTCSAFTCPADYLLKTNAASITGSSTSACCDVACSAFTCPADYLLKTNAASINSDSSTGASISETCCDLACSAFTCPAEYTLKTNAVSITGWSTSTCCDAFCSAFTCPADYLLKTNAASIAGSSTSACCDVACSAFTCPADYLLKANAASIAGSSTSACCDAFCSAFTCPADYVLKTNAASIAGSSTSTCCDLACSAFTCPANYILKAKAATLAGSGHDTCCDVLCRAFSCPTNYILKANTALLVGFNQDTCCDVSCAAFTCPVDYTLKATAAGIAGSSHDTCCDVLCSAFTCPLGQSLKGNAAYIRGSAADICCDLTCITFNCEIGTIKPDADAIIGSSLYTCCDVPMEKLKSDCEDITHASFNAKTNECECGPDFLFEGSITMGPNGLEGSCAAKELVCFHQVGESCYAPDDMDECTSIAFTKSISDTRDTEFCLGSEQAVSGGIKIIGVDASVSLSQEFCSGSGREGTTGEEVSFVIPGIAGESRVGCAWGRELTAEWRQTSESMKLVKYEGYYIEKGRTCPKPTCKYSPKDAADDWREQVVDCNFFGTCEVDAAFAVAFPLLTLGIELARVGVYIM